MLVFAAATMNWFLTRSRLWESAALLLIAFMLLRPGFFWDRLYPPLIEVDPTAIEQAAEAVPAGGNLRLRAEGLSIEGAEVDKTVMLPMGPAGPGAERLLNAGLELRTEDGRVLIDMIGFGSAAERAGLDFDFEITGVLRRERAAAQGADVAAGAAAARPDRLAAAAPPGGRAGAARRPARGRRGLSGRGALRRRRAAVERRKAALQAVGAACAPTAMANLRTGGRRGVEGTQSGAAGHGP